MKFCTLSEQKQGIQKESDSLLNKIEKSCFPRANVNKKVIDLGIMFFLYFQSNFSFSTVSPESTSTKKVGDLGIMLPLIFNLSSPSRQFLSLTVTPSIK